MNTAEYYKDYYVKNKERIRLRNEKQVIEKYGSFNNRSMILRHKSGTSKRYNEMYGLSYTRAYKKANWHKRQLLEKQGGKLTTATVQMVYEDNIKKYGTLTCYLCGNPIEFGKDTLEHKIPLSRGGTNNYDNLEIACLWCNQSKGRKTLDEYKERL